MSSNFTPAHRDIQSQSVGNPNLKMKREVKPIQFKSQVNGSDLKSNITKLEEASKLLYDQWSQSLSDGNAATTSFLLEDYQKTVRTLAQISKDAPNVLALNNESAPMSAVTKSFQATMFDVRSRLDSLAARLSELVLNKTAIEVSEIVTKEVNIIIDDMYANAFLKGKVE